MEKTFVWQGKTYKLGRFTLDDAEKFLELAEGLDADDATPLSQLRATRQMVQLLHSPAEIEVYPDNIAELLAALQAAQFGIGDDSGNREGGEQPPRPVV